MWRNLEDDIRAMAIRLVQEFEKYARTVHDENRRRERRSSGTPAQLPLHRPATWRLSPGFNPYHVRAHAAPIARAIALQLQAGTYTPRPPAGFTVPKSPTERRLINTFEIADEVISNKLMRSLMRKNNARLSSRAYAYRSDRSPHDAIDYVRSELRLEERVFVAEYDFSKFFDKVSHEHIKTTLDNLGIIRTPLESGLIERFLSAPEPYLNLGDKATHRAPRTMGIPQGTSISLFLANIAASPLDRQLERLGVEFARYADDTLIWSRSYERICDAAEAIHSAASLIGSPINAEKSKGIRLLVPQETDKAEMTFTREVDYLGHSIGLRRVGLKSTAISRLQSRTQELIYSNLLREPLNGTQALDRLSAVDQDYVTYIWQLRRYLYGPLSENQVRRFQHGSIPPMSFQGAMSFFPLVDDEGALIELDAFISSQTWLALRKRSAILGSRRKPEPWGESRHDLIGFQTYSRRTGQTIDLRIPSVHRIAGVIRKAVSTYGVGVVGKGLPLYLYET